MFLVIGDQPGAIVILECEVRTRIFLRVADERCEGRSRTGGKADCDASACSMYCRLQRHARLRKKSNDGNGIKYELR